MRTIFMGTPEFAVRMLDALVTEGVDIVGVFTQTDKPKGRGYQLAKSPVKEYAEAHGLDVYQPRTLRCEEALELVKSLEPELIVVAAYGKILPKEILDLPPLGCVNVHGSVLPEYRGASPVQRCIMDGKTETGITLMMMDEGVDTGCMIACERVQIPEDMNCGELFDVLGELGARMLKDELPNIISGKCRLECQRCDCATYASKIEKSELAIDFSLSAMCIHNKCRGVYPYLCCGARLVTAKGERNIRFARTAACCDSAEGAQPGTVIFADAKAGYFTVACGKGALKVLEIIPEGKQKMPAADFIRGRQIAVGDRFI